MNLSIQEIGQAVGFRVPYFNNLARENRSRRRHFMAAKKKAKKKKKH